MVSELLHLLPHLEQLVRQFSVAAQSQVVTVTFPTTANQDQIIIHKLTPPTVDSVCYEVIKADRACRVYNDQSTTHVPWAINYVVLRCDTASAAVTLRLTVNP